MNYVYILVGILAILSIIGGMLVTAYFGVLIHRKTRPEMKLIPRRRKPTPWKKWWNVITSVVVWVAHLYGGAAAAAVDMVSTAKALVDYYRQKQ
jgi:hypothetical protein